MPSDLDREQAARARARRARAQQIQRRRIVFVGILLAIILLIVVLAAKSCGEDGGVVTTTTGNGEPGSSVVLYVAELTGADSVPAVDTQAAAVLTLEYDADAGKLTYELEVTSRISNPNVATIYQGRAGEYGTAVYTLFAGQIDDEEYTGVLAKDEVSEADLVGPLKGGTLADLVALIEEGEAYVSIGNERHPVDAIRGHIERAEDSNTGSDNGPDDGSETTEAK